MHACMCVCDREYNKFFSGRFFYVVWPNNIVVATFANYNSQTWFS